MTDTMMPSKPLTLIVAATQKNLGIGRDGALPWPMLRQEMAYFARVTKHVPPPRSPTGSDSAALLAGAQTTSRNAVIMGRKTWASIPAKFRPLKDRLNVVITRSGSLTRADAAATAEEREGHNVRVAGSLGEAVQLVGQDQSVCRVFVIGGASIYEEAMAGARRNAGHGLQHDRQTVNRVLLTKIRQEFECDTYFPTDLEGEEAKELGWERKSLRELSEWIGDEVPGQEGILQEQGIEYEFCLFERPQGGTSEEG